MVRPASRKPDESQEATVRSRQRRGRWLSPRTVRGGRSQPGGRHGVPEALVRWGAGTASAGSDIRHVACRPEGADAVLNVVGEGSYQDGIGKGTAGGKTVLAGPNHVAILLQQPSNQYDPNAIMVLIDGTLVGLPEPRRRHRLRACPCVCGLEGAGKHRAATRGSTGGWQVSKTDVGSYGVVLKVGWPDGDEVRTRGDGGGTRCGCSHRPPVGRAVDRLHRGQPLSAGGHGARPGDVGRRRHKTGRGWPSTPVSQSRFSCSSIAIRS